jgi:hypothetical protein
MARLIVVRAQSSGNLAFGPVGGPPPEIAIRFRAGQIHGKDATVAVGAAGAFVVVANMGPGTASLLMDVKGYYADPRLEQSTTAPPAFNPPPGNLDGRTPVQIVSSTPGARIFYTTDGSTPSSSNGILYTGLLSIPKTTVLAAFATAPGLADSPVSSGQYNVAQAASLFLAQMIPQGSSLSLGFGSASLLLAPDQASAVLHYTYSNLSGPIIAQHIHGPGGPILFDIDTSTPDATGGRTWTIVPAGGFTAAQIIAALFGGQCYVNLHTALYPAGEIKGFLNLSTGSAAAAAGHADRRRSLPDTGNLRPGLACRRRGHHRRANRLRPLARQPVRPAADLAPRLLRRGQGRGRGAVQQPGDGVVLEAGGHRSRPAPPAGGAGALRDHGHLRPERQRRSRGHGALPGPAGG